MYKSAPLLQRAFLTASVSFAMPAHARIPVVDDVKDGLEHIVKEGGKVAEKGLRELGNAVGDISEEGEKLVKKTFKEMENAGKDLETLAREGKCGGDICIAIEAAAEFSANNIKETGDVWKETAKRLSEGKPLDAMWHLAVDPVNNQQENAAQAAMKSSVLRAVGQVAASAYFGPGGAAAYATWLTYHSTDGNIELALKAGAIAGATAYAMDAISKDVAVMDVAKNMKADEIVQRAIMSGAVSGLAVALSGGTKEEIEQAFTKGAVTSVIRDGYKELTQSHLQDNMKASKGLAYCLGADPNAVGADGKRLGCLPDAKAYINKDGTPVEVGPDGKINVSKLQLDRYGKPEIEFTELDYARPHVGTFAEVEKAKFAGETSDFMTGVSRIPGMNGMSIAHDIFVGRTDDVFPVGVDLVYSVGTIAPFVVMTYEGAGFGVQEMLRDVSARTQKMAVIDDSFKSTADPTNGETVASAGEPKKTGNLENSIPVEIRHLYCKRDDDSVKNFLMESPIPASDPAEYKRICRIDQNHGGNRWAHLWHAHHEKSFCTVKFNDILVRYVERGYTCYTNRGIRFDQAKTDPKIAAVAPSP